MPEFRALVDREQMLDAFAVAASVASPRSPKPILQNVLMTATESGATLSATDMEIGVRREVLGVKSDGGGSVVLPAARFGSILRSCGDDELSIDADDGRIVVKGLQSSFTLSSDDPELFPAVNGFDAKGWIVVAPGDLRKLIRRTVFCCNPTEMRYAMGGVLFDARGDRLRCVSTDGKRLAVMECDIEREGELPEPGLPVVPVKAIKLIEKSIEDDGPPLHLAFTGRSVFVRTENATITSRLVEGKFPQYEQVFPKATPVVVAVGVAAFRSAVEQSSIVTTEESRSVEFKFGSGLMRLSSQSADTGSSIVDVPIGHDGPDVGFLASPVLLSEALRTVPDDESVNVEIVDDKAVIGIKSLDGYSYYVSPMSRDK